MIFEIIDQFHRKIVLKKERCEHILEHPELSLNDLERIKETILIPDIIKQSNNDKKVWLYYKLYKKTKIGRKHLVAIIKISNHSGFIITSYFTDKVKEGKTIWQR